MHQVKFVVKLANSTSVMMESPATIAVASPMIVTSNPLVNYKSVISKERRTRKDEIGDRRQQTQHTAILPCINR